MLQLWEQLALCQHWQATTQALHGTVVSSDDLQGATIGDIDMDGDLELVIGTTSGKIYALSGKTGQDTGAFPFETRGRVMAPVRMATTAECGRGAACRRVPVQLEH
jgi:hypothetical protein